MARMRQAAETLKSKLVCSYCSSETVGSVAITDPSRTLTRKCSRHFLVKRVLWRAVAADQN